MYFFCILHADAVQSCQDITVITGTCYIITLENLKNFVCQRDILLYLNFIPEFLNLKFLKEAQGSGVKRDKFTENNFISM